MKIIAFGFLLLITTRIKTGNLAVVIANESENILYKDLDNPLKALVEKNSKESVFLSTDNGEIKRYGKNEEFVIRPVQTGITKITVYKVSKTDTVAMGVKVFRTIEVPLPVAYMGGKKGGGFLFR